MSPEPIMQSHWFSRARHKLVPDLWCLLRSLAFSPSIQPGPVTSQSVASAGWLNFCTHLWLTVCCRAMRQFIQINEDYIIFILFFKSHALYTEPNISYLSHHTHSSCSGEKNVPTNGYPLTKRLLTPNSISLVWVCERILSESETFLFRVWQQKKVCRIVPSTMCIQKQADSSRSFLCIRK